MAEGPKRVNPSVLTALKVLCEASEDDLMDAVEEFRVAHRSRLAALFGQSVADGLNAFKQHGDVSTYDPAALAAALFGDLPAGPDSPSDDEGRPSGSAQLPASTVESGHTWETLWWEATPSVIGRQTQQMFRVRKPPRQTTPTSCQWSWTTPSSREIRRPVRCDLQSQEQRGRTSEEASATSAHGVARDTGLQFGLG